MKAHLMRPPLLWKDGKVIDWDRGTTHVWGELATRGSNVFEGIRATRSANGQIWAVELDRHLGRLFRSARMLGLPTDQTPESIKAGIGELLEALPSCTDYYIRPTLCLEEGRWETDPNVAVVSCYIVAVPIDPYTTAPATVSCTVSEHRKLSDAVFPALIKCGAVYQLYRLPMLDARRRGFDEAILLGLEGQVTETTGSSILCIRDGELRTPPIDDGILDSITRRRILLLAEGAGIPVCEQRMAPEELFACDEVLLAGTLSGITSVEHIDGRQIGTGKWPMTEQLYSAYLQLIHSPEIDEEFAQPLPSRGLSR